MTDALRRWTTAAVMALCVVLVWPAMGEQPPLTLEQVRAAIEASGAGWTAGETSVSRLPRQDQLGMLLDEPPPVAGPGDPVRDEPARESESLPSAWDWRDVDGGNFTTAVGNQGTCGACWAFATVGAMEAAYEIVVDEPEWNPDFSEQILVSCLNYDGCDGASMETGPSFLISYGTGFDWCFEYRGRGDIPCEEACPTWTDDPWTLDDWWYAGSSTEDIKQALVDEGPVVMGMAVYEDFNYYTSGVYEHTTGSGLGWHAVLLVGYDDGYQAWIGKNSWGDDWGDDPDGLSGERGWFRIKYGDVSMSGYEAIAVTVPAITCHDDDGDGVRNCDGDCDDNDPAANLTDLDGDGFHPCMGDCDETDPDAYPHNSESCDGVDNDCDPSTDENTDHDLDGYTICDGDCDEGNSLVNPGQTENCYDNLDNDCDGRVDHASPECGTSYGEDDELELPETISCGCVTDQAPSRAPLAALVLMAAALLRRYRSSIHR